MPAQTLTKQATSTTTATASSTGATKSTSTTTGSGAGITANNAAAHQDTLGNAGVAQSVGVASGGAVGAASPAWSKEEIIGIQTELQRARLYAKKIDGQLGTGTRAGLTAAFGGDHWSALDAAAALAQLKSLAPGLASGSTSWSSDQKKAVQRELARLGLYSSTIDGDLGKGSKAALVEAFGGDEWSKLSAEEALKRLMSATPSPSAGGIRYGEMFKDGLLDMTLGLGFDEADWHLTAAPKILEALKARGFKEDAGGAAELYKKAGRKLGDSTFGKYFVKRGAITWKPPAGAARPVDAVIRFVTNDASGKSKSDGEGGRAANAYLEGMQSSDVSYYAGHGRYGSGPDFDRNMRFQSLNAKGDVEKEYDDYSVLEKDLAAEGAAKKQSAWSVYQARTKAGTLKMLGVNDGNLMMNPSNSHSGEFGGNAMYESLKGAGKKPITGKDGALGQTDKPYRLMVFDGCRTEDYKKSVRGTPNTSAKDASVIDTTRVTYWGDEAETIGAFIDGVLATESSKGLTGKMDAKQQVDTSAAFEFS